MIGTTNKKTLRQRQVWVAWGLSAISGGLIAASMPNFDIHILGWVASVPLLLAIQYMPDKSVYILALPFGIIWSIAVHNWYPVFLGPVAGYVLIVSAGIYYTTLIGLGVALQRRLPAPVNLLALPVLWSAIEFVKYVAPIVEDMWFVLLANSQWRFPPALQILSVTGVPGLSFLLMLANVALAALVWRTWRERKMDWGGALALGCVIAIVAWGAVTIPAPPAKTFAIAATSDLANQDPDIKKLSKTFKQIEAPYADTPEMSQALFDVNAELTRQVAGQGVAFVVWRAPTGMYDTALLVGPDGQEVGRRAKIYIMPGEKQYGYVAGLNHFPVYDTPYGKVGIAVCVDRHRLWITRELARAGAQIVLMSVDDDYNHNSRFLPFHAADGVFRAVENRVTIGLGAANGISLIVDPYGRIMAQSGANERSVITGQTFIVSQRPLYTVWGDWFGWLMVVGLLALTGVAIVGRKCE